MHARQGVFERGLGWRKVYPIHKLHPPLRELHLISIPDGVGMHDHASLAWCDFAHAAEGADGLVFVEVSHPAYPNNP